MTPYFRIWHSIYGAKIRLAQFFSLRHIPDQDQQYAGSIIFLSHSSQTPIQAQNDVFCAFFANPLLTPYLRGHNEVVPILNIAYATVQLQTFQTRGRSTFHLIPSRHLFNHKMTFKASGCGRRRRLRITLALCK